MLLLLNTEPVDYIIDQGFMFKNTGPYPLEAVIYRLIILIMSLANLYHQEAPTPFNVILINLLLRLN